MTLANAISGTGTLTQAGAGTLTLTGANSYSGLTTINTGAVLQLGAGGTSGQLGAGAVLNHGALVVDRADAITLAGAISGSGSLTQLGAGTLTLTGANSYAGSTAIVTGSTLRVEGAGTLGTGEVVINGALIVARPGDIALAGAVWGGGSLTQAGSGRLTLTGTSTHTGGTTISAGTLRIGDGGTTGSITGNVTNNAALVFNRSENVTFGGVVSGSGSLTQAGTGTLTLTGANSHTGGTTIAGGTLAVSAGGSLSSNATVTVGAEGTLIYESGTNAGNNTHVVQGGSSVLANSGRLRFLGTASAGTGTYTNAASTGTPFGSTISFEGSSTAGTATLINAVRPSGYVAASALLFRDQSSMGAATIISEGGGIFQSTGNRVELQDDATGGTASITLGGNNHIGPGSSMTLSGRATAAAATIRVGAAEAPAGSSGLAAGAVLDFQEDSTAGTARITAEGGTAGRFGGLVRFRGTQDAAQASIRVEGNAVLDIRVFTGSAFRLGSLSGDGTVSLGGKELRLGGTNASMSFGGVLGADGQGGVLTKEGTGSLVLTGANRLTSASIAQGVLQLGEGGSLGTAPIGIAAGARLEVNSSDSLTLAQTISGAGALRQIGTGTTILTGANTYSGGTTISAGTLELGAGGTLGTGAVVNNATLAINRADAVTIANAISGTGVLRQSGSGTTTLTGANSHSGGTVIAAGTLSVASDANLGAASAGLTLAGGTLATNASFTSARPVTLEGTGGGFAPAPGVTLTLQGGIAGPGGLTLAGPGTLRITAPGTYAGPTQVMAGSVLLAAGGMLGAGPLTVAAGAVLDATGASARNMTVASLAGEGLVRIGHRSLTLTQGGTGFGGTLTDGGLGGALTLAGGTTRLDGSASYTGRTLIQGATLVLNGLLDGTSEVVINEGRLVVNGTLRGASAVTLNGGALVVNGDIGPANVVINGGTLGGTGTLPGVTVASGATLAPGNSIGTIHLSGLVLAPGSTTAIEVQGLAADRINVSGNATLGGTLQLLPLGGPYSFNTPYTILQAGSVSGNFAAVTTTGSFGAGVEARVSVTATQVLLGLVPAMLVPPDPTPQSRGIAGFLTYNLRATAGALDQANRAGGNLSPFFNVYNQPASTIGLAVNQLSGEIATTTGAMGFASGDRFLATMLDPLGHGRESMMGGRLRPGEAANAKRYAVWATATGAYNRTTGDASDGSASRTARTAGFALGFDHRIGAASMAGVAIAVGESSASLASGQGSSTANFGQIGAYGTTRLGSFTVSGAAAFTFMDVDTKRTQYFLNSDQQRAGFGAQVYSLRAEVRQDGLAFGGGLRLQPIAALQWQQVNNQGYTESSLVTGVGTGVTVGGQSQAALRSELGAQLDGVMRMGAVPVQGYLRAAWAHYLTRDASMAVGFATLPDAGFTVRGARPDANAALLSGGLEVPVARGLTLGARVESEFSGNVSEVAGTARLRFAF